MIPDLDSTITTEPTTSEVPLADLLEAQALNVTRLVPAQYTVVLFGYITPVSFVITVGANIIIVMVLSRPNMRTPTNTVLLAMAVADLLTLLFPVPWYFYLYTLGHYRHHLHPAPVCNLFNYMTEILPAFFHTASVWCTVLLACQRYVYICHPTLAKVWCTNQRVTRTIGLIFAVALLHQLLRFFDSYYEDVELPAKVDSWPPKPRPACRYVQASWVASIEDFYYSSYFVFRIVFIHVGPCLSMVVFNFLLYIALKKAERTRNRLFYQHNSNHNQLGSSGKLTSGATPTTNGVQSRQSICVESATRGKMGRGRDANSTTVMLIVVVTVVLMVEIPLAVTTAVHITENLFGLELVSDRLLNLTIVFTNFFIIISYPFNFAIYCGMSRAFRETFQQTFPWCCRVRYTTSSTATQSETPSLSAARRRQSSEVEHRVLVARTTGTSGHNVSTSTTSTNGTENHERSPLAERRAVRFESVAITNQNGQTKLAYGSLIECNATLRETML